MKSNEVLQKDVQEAIKWESLLEAAEIGVTAKDGVVTLTGIVDGYAKKLEAEDAAKKVNGVRVVVEKIEVQFADHIQKNDNDIAIEVIHAYKWHWEFPGHKVQVKVEDGWITLEGELQWNYQKLNAKAILDRLHGIKGVINNIKVKSLNHNDVEKKSIENALKRNWSITSQDIEVSVEGKKLYLAAL